VKYDSLFTRLIANTVIPEGQNEHTGCWGWNGYIGKHGYGTLSIRLPNKINPMSCLIHREMEQIVRGEYNEFDLDDDPLGPIMLVPRPRLGYDETVDHLCCFRRCGNPDHWLDPISRAENTALMQARKKVKTLN
jgi:hypothetical protein